MRVGKKTWYNDVLHIPEGQSGDFAIVHKEQPAGHPFNLSNFRTTIYGQKVQAPVTYPFPTKWHTLTENGSTWMSDVPIEQTQHDELLKGFKGRVLIGGLGLGYAVTALMRKPAVREIVVVEKEQDVINLVWPHLVIPKRMRNSVHVVCMDLFEYLKESSKDSFKYGFYDIWAMDGETTFHSTVVPLRELSHGKVDILRCWNEDIMRGQLRMSLYTRMDLLQHPELIPTPDKDAEQWLRELSYPEKDNIWMTWSAPFYQKIKSIEELKSNRDFWNMCANHYVELYKR